MDFAFSDCRRVLLRGVLAALRATADKIRTMPAERDAIITGIALDLAPWHPGVGLALRLNTDPRDDNGRYSSVEWQCPSLVRKGAGPAGKTLVPAAKYIHNAYEARGEGGRPEMAHLIFLAGAEALLAPNVARLLQTLGVDAPVITDRLGPEYFEYIVVDPDGTLPGNYCNVVLAMRVTERLLKIPVEPDAAADGPSEVNRN